MLAVGKLLVTQLAERKCEIIELFKVVRGSSWNDRLSWKRAGVPVGAAGLIPGRRSGFGCRCLQGKGGAQAYTQEQEEETGRHRSDTAHGFLPPREISRNFRFQPYLCAALCAGLPARSNSLPFEIANTA
jgi:hypothetical protein